MRTDSPKLSDTATQVALQMIAQHFPSTYSATKQRLSTVQQGQSKGNAQEAHEAIRPVMNEKTGVFYLPEEIDLSESHCVLYVLILQRTLAALMANSVSETHTQ